MEVEYTETKHNAKATATTSDGEEVSGHIIGVWRIAGDVQRIEIDSPERDLPLNIARERVEVGR